MLRSGLTHKQIAEAVSREVGQPISRSTVSAALLRAGLSSRAKKYEEEIPWIVRQEHQTHYAARMLRLLGRRRSGLQNSTEMEERLDSWLASMKEAHALVTYVPELDDGFVYVDGDFPENGVPIMEVPPI